MKVAHALVALVALASPMGCALFGFDLGDYGGAGDDGTDGSGGDASGADGSESAAPDGQNGGDGFVSETGGEDAPADGRPDAGRDGSGDGGDDAPADGPFDSPMDTGPGDTGPKDTGTDTALPPCSFSTYKRVFVSSGTYSVAALGGLANADMICGTLAANAGIIEPNFRAWLSDETTSAASRITHNATDAYVLMDKATVVACTWSELVSVPHRHGIDHNESGVGVPLTPTCGGVSDRAVWTGTSPDGAQASGKTCASWSTGSGAGTMGYARAVDGAWTAGCTGAGVCAGTGAIYCVEQ